MSPALTNLKSKNLASKQQNLVSSVAKPETESPLKDNMYFAHQSVLNTKATPNTEIVYKRGARSISKRRDSTKNLLNLTQTDQAPSRKEVFISGSKRNLLASDSKISLGQNTERRKLAHIDTCKACQNKEVDGHDHSVSNSLDRRLRKFHQNFNASGHCKQHNALGC